MKKLLVLLLFVTTHASALSVKDAYIRESFRSGESIWQMGNARIQLELTYNANQLVLTRLSNPATGINWTPPRDQASLAQPVVVRYHNQEHHFQVPDQEGSFQLKAHNVASDDKSVRLELVFTRAGVPPSLEILLCYRILPQSFVECWAEVVNLNPATESSLELLRVGRAHLVVGSQEGRWEVADTQASRYGEPLRIDWLDLPHGQLRTLPLLGSSSRAGGGAGFGHSG